MSTCDDSTESTMRALEIATGTLMDAVARLTEPQVREPSLLPGWSRAHVLAHLAGNAEGGSRLLEGVALGVPGWEYRDLATREADIEAGSEAPVEVLVAQVGATAKRFATAYTNVSPEQWSTPVTWTTGHQSVARKVVTSRLFEVEIHHVDLQTGRTVGHWPPELVATMFDVVVGAFTARSDVPSLRIEIDDQPAAVALGDAASPIAVGGPRGVVLAWLLGRSDGHDLRVDGPELPPSLPNLY